MLGWEARFTFGITAPVVTGVFIDIGATFGHGYMLRYSDTLDCRTFKFGS